MAIEVLTGEAWVAHNASAEEVADLVLERGQSPEIPADHVTPDLAAVLEQCFHPEMNRRPTVTDLGIALRDQAQSVDRRGGAPPSPFAPLRNGDIKTRE